MAKNYTVDSVTERFAPTPGRGFVAMVLVNYHTPRNYVGTVEVPKAEATPERIKQAIESDVARVEGIFQL